jgi:sortase (surface protein transpeptidase)
MGLIRFLIIAICSLYIIRSLVRIFLPMLFNSVINKAQEQARQQQQNYQQQQQRPDGRVRVDYKPEGKKSSVPDSEGEFVDYEEIK